MMKDIAFSGVETITFSQATLDYTEDSAAMPHRGLETKFVAPVCNTYPINTFWSRTLDGRHKKHAKKSHDMHALVFPGSGGKTVKIPAPLFTVAGASPTSEKGQAGGSGA
jgi:hypothetical protein